LRFGFLNSLRDRLLCNAYAQDNETAWLDWLSISSHGRKLREFTRKLIAMRKAFPILYRSRFVVGSHNKELDVDDVAWLSPSGDPMTSEQWEDGNARCFGMLLDGRAQESGIKRRGSDATLLLICNAHYDVVSFTLPSVAALTVSAPGQILARQARREVHLTSTGTRHLDIGEDDVDRRTSLKDCYGLVGIACLNNFKAGIFDRLGRIYP
jgi:pullulanase/glycogen debranching enzyme